MNVKTVAALVGTLSLGSLAEGCTTAQPQVATSSVREGIEYCCNANGDVPPLRGQPSERLTSLAAVSKEQRVR